MLAIWFAVRLILPMNRFTPALVLFASASLASAAPTFDWPQWRGPQRSDLSAETGLLKQWPPEGPKQLWVYKNAGNGYSGPAIVGGTLFTLGTRDGKEIALALDAATGAERWFTPLSPVLGNNWGGGPRGTPTVDGAFVYLLTGPGTLACLQAKDGKLVWQRTMQELGGKTPGWGYTESVLVDGDQVVCTPGGAQGAIAALDKKTGATRWQSKDFTDGAQYASIIPANINGEHQYVQLTMQTLVGVSAKDGAVLWRTPFPGKTAVIPTPIVKGNEVFVTAGYGVGCQLIRIEPGNKLTVVYENKTMKNHHGGVILVGDHLYGHSDGVGWVCMDWKTGSEVWSEKGKLGKGALGYADGMLYCLEESTGNVALVEASPKGWNEKGRFKLDPQTDIRSPQGRIWTHPVISNGRLYLRDQDFIHCYAVK
ncbi:MAG: outer membrane protein assembly factor BamB [Chthoniobacter sp.]|jgi:outer membrane protein assembly factor BamB|nr:outer membrane protein assembly factor BamB [Chthoniobacter sp.]